ncbi:MAG: hypothetical protein JJU02_14605 [Cryomorphaceae bacterium]|nr:hypothetical protein [Cryomorphaceae bacterium]
MQIGTAQVRTVTAANREMLLLYWKVGHLILAHQSQKGWGAKVVDLLSEDLKKELPNQKGFSIRNLKYMRKFALQYPLSMIKKLNEASNILLQSEPSQKSIRNIVSEFVPQAVAQLQIANYQADIIVQPLVAQNDDASFLASVISKIS